MAKNKKPLTKKQRRKRKLIVFIIEIIVVLILLGVLWVVAQMSKINHQSIDKDKIIVNPVAEKTDELLQGYTNIALLGLDNRSNGTYESGNADTIMIASINNETKEVKLVSVYRDTYLNVDPAQGSYSKINSAYARNGAEGMINALNTNLDLDIKEFIAVDWKALAETVNLLGGIDVELSSQEAAQMNKYMNEGARVTGITGGGAVAEGSQHLDGLQALAYARIRKLAGDDYKRTERQRIVVQKMVEKALNSDVGTITSVINQVFPDIYTSLSVKRMITLAAGAFDYRLTDNRGFPELRCGKSVSGSGSCIIPCDLLANVADLHKFLFNNDAYSPSSTVTDINNQIINLTGLTGANAQ